MNFLLELRRKISNAQQKAYVAENGIPSDQTLSADEFRALIDRVIQTRSCVKEIGFEQDEDGVDFIEVTHLDMTKQQMFVPIASAMPWHGGTKYVSGFMSGDSYKMLEDNNSKIESLQKKIEEIGSNDGHWESTDMSDAFGETLQRKWTLIDGLLRIAFSDNNYNSTGCHEGAFGKKLVTAKKGDKVYITCGIALGEAKNGHSVLVTAAGGTASIMKPVIKYYTNTETVAGVSFVAEEDIELYINNAPDVVPNPSIVISSYVSNGMQAEGGGINPWKDKKMLVMGASSTGRGSTNSEFPNYPSYAVRTAELLGMDLVDRTSNPRLFAAGGKAYQWKSGSQIIYTDLTEAEFTSWDKTHINYYHFQEQRGERSTKWSFVSYDIDSKNLVLTKDGENKTFALDTSVAQPLPGLFNLGAAATIAEFEASGRTDRKSESYENYLLDTSIDLLVLGNQGIEVDATGDIDAQIVPLMRRPTLSNPHFSYSDGVSLEDRRNSNTGSILYLIEKIVQANPKVRVVLCHDGNLPTDPEGRGDWGLARNMGYQRFKQTAVMAMKFGIPFINHAEKLMLNYANWSVYGASDKQHPSEAMYKWMGEMFAGELLAGTMNDAASYWFTDIVELVHRVEVLEKGYEDLSEKYEDLVIRVETHYLKFTEISEANYNNRSTANMLMVQNNKVLLGKTINKFGWRIDNNTDIPEGEFYLVAITNNNVIIAYSNEKLAPINYINNYIYFTFDGFVFPKDNEVWGFALISEEERARVVDNTYQLLVRNFPNMIPSIYANVTSSENKCMVVANGIWKNTWQAPYYIKYSESIFDITDNILEKPALSLTDEEIEKLRALINN